MTVPFVYGCGRCEWCRAGDGQVCPAPAADGLHLLSSFAERVALAQRGHQPRGRAGGVDFAAAAGLGCRSATAYRALVRRARVSAGEWVTVVGADGVGLSAVMIARALGGRVVVVDRNPEALATAATPWLLGQRGGQSVQRSPGWPVAAASRQACLGRPAVPAAR